MTKSPPWEGDRGSVGSLVAIGVAALLGGAALAAGDGPSGPSRAPIEAKVLRQLATKGHASFWVVLRAKADVSSASRIDNRSRRGEVVYKRLTALAHRSQAPIRALLDAQGIRYQPFWIVNAIHVKSAGRGDGGRDGSALRRSGDTCHALLPDPKADQGARREQSVHDGVGPERDPRAAGVVDVQRSRRGHRRREHRHRASVTRTRPSSSSTAATWAAPSTTTTTGGTRCTNARSAEPCDTDTHGTHTMGTMVGDDGDPGANQIGVAPHAKWISAKGCCLDTALISSAQWILAPTDLTGANPRPDLRPDVVNNSWGGGSGDPFFRPAVQAWIASGIFPAFSNGNNGPACGTAGLAGGLLRDLQRRGVLGDRARSRASRLVAPPRSAGSSSPTSPRLAPMSAPR